MVSKFVHRSVDLANSISKTLLTKQLIKRNDRVLLSISGGQDSLSLVLLFNQLYAQLNLQLGLFWCNHLWQIDSFTLMRQITKISYLFQFNGSFAISPKFVPSELLARNWRHDCSYRTCLFYNYSKTILAHSANDKVETILLNLIRGTGLTGLSPLRLNSSSLIGKEKHRSQKTTFPMFFFSWSPVFVHTEGSHGLVTLKDTIDLFTPYPPKEGKESSLQYELKPSLDNIDVLNRSVDKKVVFQENTPGIYQFYFLGWQDIDAKHAKQAKKKGILAIFSLEKCIKNKLLNNKTFYFLWTFGTKSRDQVQLVTKKSIMLDNEGSYGGKLDEKVVYGIKLNDVWINPCSVLTLEITKHFAEYRKYLRSKYARIHNNSMIEKTFFFSSNRKTLSSFLRSFYSVNSSTIQIQLIWVEHLHTSCLVTVQSVFQTPIFWISEKIFLKKQKKKSVVRAKFKKSQTTRKENLAKIWFHFVSYTLFKSCFTCLQETQSNQRDICKNLLDSEGIRQKDISANFLNLPKTRSYTTQDVQFFNCSFLDQNLFSTWLSKSFSKTTSLSTSRNIGALRPERSSGSNQRLLKPHVFIMTSPYKQLKIKVPEDILLLNTQVFPK